MSGAREISAVPTFLRLLDGKTGSLAASLSTTRLECAPRIGGVMDIAFMLLALLLIAATIGLSRYLVRLRGREP